MGLFAGEALADSAEFGCHGSAFAGKPDLLAVVDSRLRYQAGRLYPVQLPGHAGHPGDVASLFSCRALGC